MIKKLKEKILDGYQITKEEALQLYVAPLDELCTAADEIRTHFCGDTFDLCTIINAKSGRCSEDCKYCAQASIYSTGAEEYPLLDIASLVAQAKKDEAQGVLRYSLVTSGKCLTDEEVNIMGERIRAIRRETNISICISFGLLEERQYRQLKDAGVSRVHNNLETSQNYFPHICTTHSFSDKVKAIRAAQNAGLDVCSGGIMGMGEKPADRIDMALSLRQLGVRSVPVNILNPILGTPLANNAILTNDDVRRIVAIYRFILPHASIRLAGGRGLLKDQGRACFMSGANAAISGDMLTTGGISIRTDLDLLEELNYKAGLFNG